MKYYNINDHRLLEVIEDIIHYEYRDKYINQVGVQISRLHTII